MSAIQRLTNATCLTFVEINLRLVPNQIIMGHLGHARITAAQQQQSWLDGRFAFCSRERCWCRYVLQIEVNCWFYELRLCLMIATVAISGKGHLGLFVLWFRLSGRNRFIQHLYFSFIFAKDHFSTFFLFFSFWHYVPTYLQFVPIYLKHTSFQSKFVWNPPQFHPSSTFLQFV